MLYDDQDNMRSISLGSFEPFCKRILFSSLLDTSQISYNDGTLKGTYFGHNVVSEGSLKWFIVSTRSAIVLGDFTLANYYYDRLVATCPIPVAVFSILAVVSTLIGLATYYTSEPTPVEPLFYKEQSFEKRGGSKGDQKKVRGGRNERSWDHRLPRAEDYDLVFNPSLKRFVPRAIAHGGDEYDWLIGIARNIRPASFSSGDLTMRSMVFFVDSRRFYVTKHTFVALKSVNSFALYSDSGEILSVYSLDQFTYKYVEGQDLVAVTLHRDPGVPGIRDIVKRICSDYRRPTEKCIRLMKLEKDGASNLFCTVGNDIEYRETTITNQYKTLMAESSVAISGYYLIRSVKGEAGYCMFPYLSLDPRHQNSPIMGLHVGRVGDDAVACGMNIEDFPSIAQGSTDVMLHDVFFDNVNISEFVPENSEAFYRPVKSCYVPAFSKIEKSLIYHYLPDPGMAPSHLGKFINDDGVEISPMANVDAKIARSVPRGAPEGVYDCVEALDFYDGLGVPTSSFNWYVCSAQEAVVGIPGRLKNMPLNTAAGFPYMGKKKSDFLNDGVLKDEHAKASDDLLSMWRTGKFTSQVVTDNLKDECRDYERVNAGKTRLFNPGGFVEYITIKRVLGEVIEHIEHRRGRGAMKIGINPFSAEWDYEATNLFNKGGSDRVMGGDFAGMDLSTRRWLAWCFYKYLVRCTMATDESDLNLLLAISYNVFTTIHVRGCLSYVLWFGNSSGNFLTSFVNSCVCWVYFKFAFISLAPREYTKTFEESVYMMIYSDDNLGGVSKDCGFFNNLTFAAFCAEFYGVEYTSPSKSVQVNPFLAREDIIFLSRKFQRVERENGVAVYLAPLVPESLTKCLYWYNKDGSLTRAEALKAQVSSFLLELPMLPMGEARRYREMLIKALALARKNKAKIDINVPTLDVLLTSFWNSYSETCAVEKRFL